LNGLLPTWRAHTRCMHLCKCKLMTAISKHRLHGGESVQVTAAMHDVAVQCQAA
jgi:hypothetical protein